MDIIDSFEQLQARARLPTVLRFLKGVPNYRFAVPTLSETRNRDATQRLTNYRKACGGFAGGIVMTLTIIGFVVAYLLSGRSIGDFGLMDFFVFIGLFTASTLFGKPLGVLWARARAIQFMRRMANC